MKTCDDNVKKAVTQYCDLAPGDVFIWSGDTTAPPVLKTQDGYVYLEKGHVFIRSHDQGTVVMYPDACVCLNGHDG